MKLQRYRDRIQTGLWIEEQTRVALVVKTARKWMDVLVVESGRLKIVKRPVTDLSYMSPLSTNERKARASFRRMARKKGTSRNIRSFLKEALA